GSCRASERAIRPCRRHWPRRRTCWGRQGRRRGPYRRKEARGEIRACDKVPFPTSRRSSRPAWPYVVKKRDRCPPAHRCRVGQFNPRIAVPDNFVEGVSRIFMAVSPVGHVCLALSGSEAERIELAIEGRPADAQFASNFRHLPAVMGEGKT